MAEVYNAVVGSNNQAISVSGYFCQVNFTFLDFIEENWFLTTQIIRSMSRFSDFEFLSHKSKLGLAVIGIVPLWYSTHPSHY